MDALAAYREQWEVRRAKAQAAREAKPKHRQPPAPSTGEVGARWSNEERATIERMAADQKTAYEIARAVGRNDKTICRYCQEQGIALFKHSPRKLRVPDAVICREYLDGASTIQLANKYDVTYGGIVSCLKRNNVPRRSLTDAERMRQMRERADAEYQARLAEIHGDAA